MSVSEAVGWLGLRPGMNRLTGLDISSCIPRSNPEPRCLGVRGSTRTVARLASVYLHDQPCAALFTRESMISHHISNSELNWMDDEVTLNVGFQWNSRLCDVDLSWESWLLSPQLPTLDILRVGTYIAEIDRPYGSNGDVQPLPTYLGGRTTVVTHAKQVRWMPS